MQIPENSGIGDVIEAPPLHFDYDRYVSYIASTMRLNQFTQALVASELGAKLIDFDANIAIGLTGSDARLEKGVFSTSEFVLYHHEGEVFELKVMLHDYLSNSSIGSIKLVDPKGNVIYEDDAGDENPFDTNLEAKVVTHAGIYTTSFAQGMGYKKITSPNRVLDFRILVGDESVVVDAKERLINDILASRKSIKTYLKQQFNGFYESTLCGIQDYKGKEIQHFDVEKGEAYCNPSKGQGSFKYGPLRLVQSSLVRRIVRKIKTEKLVLEQLSQMPSNTSERIFWLEEQGFIENSELSDHYNFFLAQYHKAQHAAYMDEFVVAFDAFDVSKRLKYVAKTCRNIIEN